MRKLKFRVWDGNNLTNVKYGHELSFKKCGHMVCMDGADCMDIMQFTGAFDSHSNQMYINDICTVEGLGNCRVDICPFYGVVLHSIDGQEVPIIDCLSEDDSFKVIGNIHENPELMEK